MSIEDKIRDSLQQQAASADRILVPDRGMFGMLANAFNGSMRRWVWLSNLLVLIASVFLFWCGWEFFTASDLDDRVYWGICLVISGNVVSMMKMWIFQEMNRTSLMREIKRVELLLVKPVESADETYRGN
ncbi:MAG: DUF6768 family protein [Pseudomonadota bacterium]